IGDMVYLDGTNIHTICPSKKLDNRRFRPYHIKKKIGRMTYELELPTSLKVHPVFHASLLFPKPSDDFNRAEVPQLPVVTRNGEEEYEVQKILDARKKGR